MVVAVVPIAVGHERAVEFDVRFARPSRSSPVSAGSAPHVPYATARPGPHTPRACDGRVRLLGEVGRRPLLALGGELLLGHAFFQDAGHL